MDKENNQKSKGIYILPNLFTTAALLCGFYSVLSSNERHFIPAAIFIFVAMVFDAFDGRVARMTGTTSDFGVQYDSLADLISFGIAPALLMYEWTLHLIAQEPLIPSRFGWLAAFFYTACTALRLARFNTQVGVVDKKFFIGLPSPAAAGVIAGFVYFSIRFNFAPSNMKFLSTVLLVCTGLMMVSSYKYFSGKSLKINGKLPFIYSVLPVLVLGLIFIKPSLSLFILFSIYALHGIIYSLWNEREEKNKKRDK